MTKKIEIFIVETFVLIIFSGSHLLLYKMSPKRTFLTPTVSLAVSSSLIIAASAVEPPISPTASISSIGNFRVVAGTTPSPLTYTLADTAAADQDLDISIVPFMLGGNPAQPYGSLVSLTQAGQADEALSGSSYGPYTLTAGNTADLSVQPELTGLVAGDSVNLGVQLQGTNWSGPVVSNTSINVVDNRVLTGSTTINAGRHILGQIPGGTLTLDGGSLSGTEGTNIAVHSGGFAQYGNGVRLTSASDFIFNGAGQTHDLQVGYYGTAGTYSHNITLSGSNGADNYTDASGNQRHDYGGYWRTETEMGSVLGDTKTLVTGQQLTPGQVVGTSYIFSNQVPDGSTSAIERASNRVETSQPSPAESFDNGLYSADRAGGLQVNERINSLITGESIQGGNLDLSGVSLTVSGTALRDRRIEATQSTGNLQTNLGRQMVSATSQVVNQSGTLTYSSLSGSDDQATRISLADFNSSGGGVTASYSGGAQDFTGLAGQEAEVNVAANFTVDRNVTGTFYKTLIAGAGAITTLENGGAGLANENVQSGLGIQYTWSNVQNNQIDIKDQHIYIFDDSNLSTRTMNASEAYNHGYDGLNNGPTHRVHSTDTHTAIGVNDVIQLHGTRTVGDQFEGLISVNAGNGRVSGEGLTGESVVANDDFNVYTHTIGRADLNITAPAGNQLDVGDVITVENTDRSLTGEQASVQIEPQSFEGSSRWEVDYQGNSLLAAGESATMTTQFDSVGAGELGGTFTSVFTFTTQDQFDEYGHFSANFGASDDRMASGGSLYAWEQQTRQTHEYTFMRAVEQQASSGSSEFQGGADLGNSQPSLTNTAENSSSGFSAATSAAVVDSGELGANTTVSMEFAKIEDAVVTDIYGDKGGVADFATDVVDLTGLDGQLHVIELTYDDSVLAGEEGAMQVMWLTEYDTDPGAGESLEGIWVNAVLGNSDVVALDILGKTVTTGEGQQGIQSYLLSKRYSGTYESYLASLGGADPELSAWGMDGSSNTVWAVIDHNSSFAGAVPEPSSIALLGLGGLSLLLRRRR